MNGPSPERRLAARRAAGGPVTLCWTDCTRRKITGTLLDSSESGFRIMHSHAALGQGQEVQFEHAEGEGTARTVWTRVLEGSVESGLVILKHDRLKARSAGPSADE